MAKAIRYSGEFISVRGELWRVELLQEGYEGSVEALTFPAEEPLIITWNEVDKIDPVASSSAALRVVSESDRQYVDMYSVEMDHIRLDVYRKNQLYWSGALDTELYEEPYSDLSQYEVLLTFSDFAQLSRKSWNIASGFSTIEEVLQHVIDHAGINFTSRVDNISTVALRSQSDPAGESILSCCVNTENFYDEDGKPLSMREVLNEVLRVFSLQIRQKNGNLHLYDINALASMSSTPVTWDGDDARLGVEKTYNNVVCTFSEYGQSKLIGGDLSEDGLTEVFGSSTTVSTNTSESAIDGFRFKLYTQGQAPDGLANLHASAYPFKITPGFSGEEVVGIGWAMRVYNKTIIPFGSSGATAIPDSEVVQSQRLFSLTDKKYIHAGHPSQQIKLKLNMLLDPRYNPYEQPGDYNRITQHERFKKYANIVYVPFRLRILDKDGNVLCFYRNVSRSAGEMHVYANTEAMWHMWTPANDEYSQLGWAYLTYYNKENLSESGVLGWKDNNPAMLVDGSALTQRFSKAESAHYIPLPPVSGYIDLEIGTGIHVESVDQTTPADLVNDTVWLLYKKPELAIVDAYFKEVDAEDVETSSWINASAKEELSLNTILGTALYPHHSAAKGLLLFSDTRLAVMLCRRAGITARLDKLMIGTIYSNYSRRHTTLEGTARLIPTFNIVSCASTAGQFLLVKEIQDAALEQSEVLLSEISADNYSGV